MADNHTAEQRSYNMSRIRSTGSKPEEAARKWLFAHGFRYRKNVRALPGKPDIVLKKYNTVIFVHGCFWHKHDCGRFKWPTTNTQYWYAKIEANVERDGLNCEKLENSGWDVIVIWECELTGDRLERTMLNVAEKIRTGAGQQKEI